MEFFSIFLLIKTLFAPWRQYQWSYGRGFDLGRYAEVFFSNLITRGLGAFMRAVFIILGTVSEVLIFVVGLAIFIGWLVLLPGSLLGLGFGLNLFLTV